MNITFNICMSTTSNIHICIYIKSKDILFAVAQGASPLGPGGKPLEEEDLVFILYILRVILMHILDVILMHISMSLYVCIY